MLGQNPAAAQYRHSARAGEQQLRRTRVLLPGKQRNKQHHGHNGKILKNQHGQGQPALRRFRLHLLLVQGQHNGCGRQRGDTAEEHAFRHAVPAEQAQRRKNENGRPHLRRSTKKYRFFQPGKLLPRHFQANGEHEHHHAHFGKQFDGLHVFHQSEGRGAAKNAGNKQPYNGREPDLAADQQHQKGEAKHAGDIGKQRNIHCTAPEHFGRVNPRGAADNVSSPENCEPVAASPRRKTNDFRAFVKPLCGLGGAYSAKRGASVRGRQTRAAFFPQDGPYVKRIVRHSCTCARE